jgi:hypothetical protein
MHTVTKAITANIGDPTLMVNAFRAMFGKQSVEFYVQQRVKMAEADARDARLMRKCRAHSDNEYFYEHVHSAIAFIGLRWDD